MTRKALWSLIAVLTAYLCCQLRRWAALLVIALFPTGGTALQDATELVVTLPLLLALVHWIAPSVRALSHSSLKLQLQFGVIPLLSYVFDYFTRIYTDLLSSGNQAAVEFMPFVCSLAYLVFVLQTTQEQKLRSQLEQTQNSLNLQVAQAVREIDALRESQRKASTYRHDLRHHLQYISACIENGRAEAAQEYIHSVCAEIEASKVNVYCENEAANLILSAFATRAQNSGIDFRVHAAIPLVLPLPDSDLCVLLSNALENAINAGQRQREGGRDAAASGAHVEQRGGFGFGLRDPCRQLFGFGPGNQHPFAHGERAAAELRAPHDILHRTACGQLAEDVVQFRDFERRAGIGQQGRRAQPRQLRDGDEGDAPCFTRPVEGREACRNTAEYVAARGHQRMKLASAMATAASTTTAPRRATQTSWRPRIVSGSTLFVARL